jgi:Ca2+-binding EF-hand superfamily protein
MNHSLTTKTLSIEPNTTDITSKLREYMKSSHLSLQDVFKAIDVTGSGSVTNLEFKEGIRKLMTAITSKEIDELINTIEPKSDGRIDWQDFSRRFQET